MVGLYQQPSRQIYSWRITTRSISWNPYETWVWLGMYEGVVWHTSKLSSCLWCSRSPVQTHGRARGFSTCRAYSVLYQDGILLHSVGASPDSDSDSVGESESESGLESGLGLYPCGLGLGLGLHLCGLGLKHCGLGLWSYGLGLGLGLHPAGLGLNSESRWVR